ncbi:hypothetical protein V496_06325 [Pseudogymnoascus sp. VKM F-4515 (FW-2607)]|nr:hypothetical protein V496_06325 [Pseudogymnoascus sp. VKM F-4515 (FW-2607)]KFY82843.1 hypothetical protein V498_08434 [Pseudogymnoascus sp. VKM F-4517 (FW-2822)]
MARSTIIIALAQYLTTGFEALEDTEFEPAARMGNNMTPNYEVKLLLDPTVVLGADKKLTATVLSTFAITKVTKMNVQYLDKSSKVIYNAGWSPRIRKMENKDDFEETYKKRYAVTYGDIDGTLTLASSEGFDAGTTKYNAQIEWGYQKQTLSISHEKEASGLGYSGMDLPNQGDSRRILINDAPDKFIHFLSDNWGTAALAESRIFGPVLAERSIGTWGPQKLYIEIWPIKDAAGTGIEYLVEASFKTNSRTDASKMRDDLIAILQGKEWFLPQDSQKTQLIMDHY